MIGQSDADLATPSTTPGLREVGTALREVGYDSAAVRRILGVPGTDIPFTPVDLLAYDRRLDAAGGPLAAVVAIFCLGTIRPADHLVAALGKPAVDALVRSGALGDEPAGLRATVRILPHGEILLTSDRRPDPGLPAGPLHVTGINAPATLLASLTVRQPGVRALDLGTGNGIQALLAASHASSVIATDVNPRALAFGEFNAALNGVQRIEFREGSWFEPVAGERFDLVVSNPPYVISPENDLVYRDSGDEPGALCGRLVRDVADHLVDGGFSTFLVSWPLSDDPDGPGGPGGPAGPAGEDASAGSGDPGGSPDSWWAAPRSWIGPDSLAWLLMMRSEDPITHSSSWNLPLATNRLADDLGQYRTAVDRWLGYLTARRVDAVAYGAIVQQRRPGAGRELRRDHVRSGAGSASRHILRVFGAADALGAEPVQAVASRTCTIPVEARIDGTLVPADAGWTQGSAQLGLAEGVGIRADLDPVMTEVVLAVSSGMTTDDAAHAVADRMELDAADAEVLRVAACRMVAELVGLGLLELSDD